MQTMDWNASNESFCNIRCVQTEKEMNCILENHIQRTLDSKVMFIYLSNNQIQNQNNLNIKKMI